MRAEKRLVSGGKYRNIRHGREAGGITLQACFHQSADLAAAAPAKSEMGVNNRDSLERKACSRQPFCSSRGSHGSKDTEPTRIAQMVTTEGYNGSLAST